jgi:hypothetical protein
MPATNLHAQVPTASGLTALAHCSLCVSFVGLGLKAAIADPTTDYLFQPEFHSESYDLCWARREPGAANAQNRNVSKSFLLLSTRFATMEDSAHRSAAGNLLRGTGPLRSLRKACALLFASPSTAEFRLNFDDTHPIAV